MREAERSRVQRLAAEAARAPPASAPEACAALVLEARAVDRIAEQRNADRGEMHADLMGAPGLQPAFEQRGDRLRPVTEASRSRDSG